MKASFRGYLSKKDSNKSEREGLRDGSETCCDFWFGDCETEKNTRDGTTQVETRVREIWLRWFGHIQRGDSGYTGQKMLKMEPGMRKNGKPQRRFMYVMTEDM